MTPTQNPRPVIPNLFINAESYNIFLNILRSPPPHTFTIYHLKQKKIYLYYPCALYIVIIVMLLYVYSFVLSISLCLSNGPMFLLFLFISSVISRGALGDAPRSTRALRSTGWDTVLDHNCIQYVTFLTD